MMVQLETKPVLSQPDSSGWCQTIVLAKSPQQITPSDQPVWFISLASNQLNVDEAGMALLETLEATYNSIELKTAEALFQTLNQNLEPLTDLSIAAACVTLTTTTLMTKGISEVILIRQGKATTLIENQQSSWQAIEGTWNPDDIWWLSAGGVGALRQFPKDVSAENYDQYFDNLVVNFIQENTKSLAGLYFKFTPIKQTDNEEATKPLLAPLVKKKRRVMALGLIILTLLLASIFIGSKTRVKNQLETQYQTLQTKVTQSIAEVNALYPIDQVKAREQIKLTLDELNTKKDIFTVNEAWQTKWQSLYDQTNQLAQQISGEIALTDIPIWYPLNTIKPEFTGTLMTQSASNLVVWDQATSTLVKIDIDTKRNDIVAGGSDLIGATSLAVDGNRAVMLTPKGIIDIGLNQKNTSILVEADSEWLQPSLVGLYNNNVYLVDSTAQSLWRYPAITGGVGAKQNWFGPGVSLSADNYTRLGIDGQLWILSSQGKVYRYTRGAPQAFTLTGFDTPLGSNTPSFSIHAETDQVAILDADNQRVVITTKTGEYQKQIVWSGFATTQDIAFSTNQDTLFILNQGNIYVAHY